MIKYLRIFIISLMVTYPTVHSVFSQPVRRHQVKAYLNRTVLIIHEAKTQLRMGKNYTGDFARSVAHQKYARNLFLAGKLQKAVYQSHRARQLADNVIRENKGELKKELNANNEEEHLQSNIPKEEELDRDLLKSEPNMAFDDRAAMEAQVQGGD